VLIPDGDSLSHGEAYVNNIFNKVRFICYILLVQRLSGKGQKVEREKMFIITEKVARIRNSETFQPPFFMVTANPSFLKLRHN
jgi:hypothetical protein